MVQGAITVKRVLIPFHSTMSVSRLGSISETLEKVKTFYAQDRLKDATPVLGSQYGLQTLAGMGYRPVIVTARMFNDEYHSTKDWLERHFNCGWCLGFVTVIAS